MKKIGREYAGFWRRYFALILDSIILSIPLATLLFYLTRSFLINNSSAIILMDFGFIIIAAFYNTVFLSSRWQATLGKRIMRVYVVRAENEGRLSFWRSLARYLVLNAAIIICAIIGFYQLPSSALRTFSMGEQRRFIELEQRMMHQEPLSSDDQQMWTTMVQKMRQTSRVLV
jgi:uncharacterized RDD family membrane protein YckC